MTENTPSRDNGQSSKPCMDLFGRQFSALCHCQRQDDPQDVDGAESAVAIVLDSSFLDQKPDTGQTSLQADCTACIGRAGTSSDTESIVKQNSSYLQVFDSPKNNPKRYESFSRTPGKNVTLDLPKTGRQDSDSGLWRRTSRNSYASDQFGSQFLSTASSWYSSDLDPFNLVHVDDEFDFYDPTTKEMQVVKLEDVHDNVLHVREKAAPTSQSDDGDGWSSGGSSKSSVESQASDSESELEASTPPKRKPKKDEDAVKRYGSFGDVDAVTNWGTITAKMMRRKVTGFSGAVSKAVHKRRHTIRQTEVQSRHYILPSVRDRAQFVVERARLLGRRIGQERDQFDSGWMRSSTLIPLLFGDDFIDTIMLLANTVRKVIASQPVLAEAGTPCRVFGDTHGQLRDLLILFKAFGFPGDEAGEYFVFNGDFVDRGRHSLEVVAMLFAFKILMPDTVWLVRGNHEDRAMNERYGFLNDCFSILGQDVGPKTYELIQRAFDELPLACLISERVFVVHGGLGDGKFTLNDIRAVERPLRDKQLASNPMIWNMLWSDPIEDDHVSTEQGVFGVHQSPRASTGIFKFGWNVTKTFCAANGIGLIIRSHQSKEGSLGFSLMHDRMLIRVFSARDYEEHGNDGAVILISDLVKSEKHPNARKGHVIARPQVVRSVTKLQGGETKSKHRKSKKRTTKKLEPLA